MKYNTIPFKNITKNEFVGKYDGFEFRVKPSEIRYWPSELSKHCAIQLVNEIIKSDDFTTEDDFLGKILGEEIKTAVYEERKSFLGEVQDHEEAYNKLLENKREEDLLRIEKAVNV